LDYKIYDIPLSRWSKNPNLSSGVGHQITDRLNKKKFFLYHTKKSMVIHGDHESKMNYTERLKTKLVTKHNFDLSIIVPTYKNTNYLDECINSLVKSTENYNVEILIGVDGCKETMDFIKGKKFPKNVTFFYFNENEGPYSIKNTLTSICNSKNLLFFDSDDISEKELVSTIINNIDKYDCIKPKYKDFGVGITPSNKSLFGEGVFAITKELFLNMNGFEPWMMAADSDFMGRLYKTKPKILHTPQVLFKRRVHPESLTNKKETGMSSPLRAHYAKISKNKKGHGNPDKLNIRDYIEITSDQSIEVKQPEPPKEKNSVLKILDRPQVVAPQKEVKEINYEEVNKVIYNKQTNKKNQGQGANNQSAKTLNIKKKLFDNIKGGTTRESRRI
jgi:glycosyltransferase involved in cell wall biosynthesis